MQYFSTQEGIPAAPSQKHVETFYGQQIFHCNFVPCEGITTEIIYPLHITRTIIVITHHILAAVCDHDD